MTCRDPARQPILRGSHGRRPDACHACFGVSELEVTEQTDEQLAAEAAREGSDGPAFVALVERFRQRVWRICYRLLGNEQDANDAAQEVFVRLFLNRTKFAGRSKYATWVHAIAVRTCLTIRRGRGRRQRHEDTASEEQWEQQQPTQNDHGQRPCRWT